MGFLGFESRSERIAREADEREQEERNERELTQKQGKCQHSWYETSQTQANVGFKEKQALCRCSNCGKEQWM